MQKLVGERGFILLAQASHDKNTLWSERDDIKSFFCLKDGLRRAVDYMNDSLLECWSCLYDFGGPEGLREMYNKAMSGDSDAADVTLAFGPEQMAEIVEFYFLHFYELADYESNQWTGWMGYDYNAGYFWSDIYPPDYHKALSFYAEQIIEK